MLQHQDPLVYNSATGEWQNASNTGPSGAALGITLGSDIGSQVSLVPSVGDTVRVDGLHTCTILAAVQQLTNATSESVPGFACSVVFHQGQVNEQLGYLTTSALTDLGSGAAVLMTTESADGTIHSAVRHGQLTLSTGFTYAFTTMHATFPHSQILQLQDGYGLYATTPNGTDADPWIKFDMPHNGFSSGGGTSEFSPQYHLSPLHNGVLFFRGVVTLTSSGSYNGVNWASLPFKYRPVNNSRWLVADITNAGNFGYARIASNGDTVFQGIPNGFNSHQYDITGHIHIGTYDGL